MRFVSSNPEEILLVFPIPGGWEVRIATQEGYETVHISIDQAWQIVGLIHDCESVRKERKLKVEEDNHERNMKEWTSQ
jgi:hypothetical protein